MTHSVSCPLIKEKNTWLATRPTRPSRRAAPLGRNAKAVDRTPRRSFSFPTSMYTEKIKPMMKENTPLATLKVTSSREVRKLVATVVKLPSSVGQLKSDKKSWIKVRSFSAANFVSHLTALLKYTGAVCCTVSASSRTDSMSPGTIKAQMNTMTRATTR